MFPRIPCGLLLLLVVNVAHAQTIERGTVKSVDATKQTITINSGGKDRIFDITRDTQIRGAGGGELEKGLENEAFKVGASVFFATRERNGKILLIGVRPVPVNLQSHPGHNPGGDDIQRGRIKSIDIEKRAMTVTVDGNDRVMNLLDDTQVLGSSGESLSERMKDFKAGVDTYFREANRNGKPTVIAVRLVGEGRGQPGNNALPPPPVNLRPLTDLGTDEYHGFQGGLYPRGTNARPEAHENAGRCLAAQVRPLDRDGQPSTSGRIVLLSVGMSNTSQSSSGFRRAMNAEDARNPQLVFVDGAQGGMTAAAIQNPDDERTGTRYWNTVDDRLRAEWVTRDQVQIVWIKQADAGPNSGFPAYARTLEGELMRIVQVLPKRFPNVKLCYLSSRTSGGFATTRLNPEPYAYESGFSVKWLIERQINGDEELNFDGGKGEVRAPWLSWGAYLWTNGNQPRSDGVHFERSDFTDNDGTHQSPDGQTKVGNLLLDFFKSDSTTKPWFLNKN